MPDEEFAILMPFSCSIGVCVSVGVVTIIGKMSGSVDLSFVLSYRLHSRARHMNEKFDFYFNHDLLYTVTTLCMIQYWYNPNLNDMLQYCTVV